MARADLMLQLVSAALSQDQQRVRQIAAALAAEEKAKRHTVVASEITSLLADSQPHHDTPLFGQTFASPRKIGGIRQSVPNRSLNDLTLPTAVVADILDFLEEQRRIELLRAYNLEPRHRVMLTGPPGNGKTSLAEAIAFELASPLVTMEYETVVSSFLGETSSRLAGLFEEIAAQQCVLFVDEFETLAKERSDANDAGEIKRIVSTLLLLIDKLPSHVVVCAATNHPEMLDRAVWRRFQVRLSLTQPNLIERAIFIESFFARSGARLPASPERLAKLVGKASYSEIEELLLSVRRRQVLSGDYGGHDQDLAVSLIQSWRQSGSESLDGHYV